MYLRIVNRGQHGDGLQAQADEARIALSFTLARLVPVLLRQHRRVDRLGHPVSVPGAAEALARSGARDRAAMLKRRRDQRHHNLGFR